MNSVLKSDSEQCTKSKLSRVHSAPTLGPACAHYAVSQAWPGRVVGLARPCLKLGPAVSQAWPGRVPGAPCRVAAPTSALARRVPSRVLRVVSHTGRRIAHPLRRIVALPPVVSRLSRDTTQLPRIPLVTIQPIVS